MVVGDTSTGTFVSTGTNSNAITSTSTSIRNTSIDLAATGAAPTLRPNLGPDPRPILPSHALGLPLMLEAKLRGGLTALPASLVNAMDLKGKRIATVRQRNLSQRQTARNCLNQMLGMGRLLQYRFLTT